MLGDGSMAFPATWENLLRLKNAVHEHDPGSTIFPTAGANLGKGTLGIGARFTTLHWPAVEWAMHALDFGVTANQNSIPRELVFDVDAMLDGQARCGSLSLHRHKRAGGTSGPERRGHEPWPRLSKLKTGFHRTPDRLELQRRPPAHRRQVRRARGCAGARVHPRELHHVRLVTRARADRRPRPTRRHGSGTRAAPSSSIAFARVWRRLASRSTTGSSRHFWPRCGRRWLKMGRRDDKYRAARAAAFTTEVGRRYLRELSIDELPGLTTPETTAAMLSLCEALDMRIDFIAPAFGFQNNTPYGQRRAPRRSSKNSGRCAARSTRASAFTLDRVSRPKTTR